VQLLAARPSYPSCASKKNDNSLLPRECSSLSLICPTNCSLHLSPSQVTQVPTSAHPPICLSGIRWIYLSTTWYLPDLDIHLSTWYLSDLSIYQSIYLSRGICSIYLPRGIYPLCLSICQSINLSVYPQCLAVAVSGPAVDRIEESRVNSVSAATE
jgi:hypothetical protein